ncbi:uncharacterized protein EI90DRAFT_2630279 [Cantharellus anzutake]|uniref:uncharacterized protein n=1 Tax=Cantharellus anzutake TaxID=1750568 RepID=UPI001903F15B|nr:uncharacterized protein EI90DRAFT_2630279 [Cantharellus anzutake]KAF8319559.1 hypothetical protein EI90DRAFT_2630279 [Cantharellus anzutake]
MANASAKKTAAQNEVAIKNLQIGMLIANISYFLLRLILPYRTFPPTWRQLTLYIMTAIPEFVLFRHLISTGSPKREPNTGALIAPGEDLSQGGITEWCFDVIYITWLCQVGSALIGEFVWWLYLSIPLYAGFKAWSTFLSPLIASRSPPGSIVQSSNEGAVEGATNSADGLSKRQIKLQKRAEKHAQSQTKMKGRR